MKVLLITSAAPGARKGNRVTALRWAGHLKSLGHQPRIALSWEGQACEVLVALHARKSAASVARIREQRPDTPVVVALTGTDVYHDLPTSLDAQRTLELADRLVVLQPLAVERLPVGMRAKARIIFQSAHPARPSSSEEGIFQVCLLSHLRGVKDPFLAAAATRLLPARSRVRVVHLGAALDTRSAGRARDEMQTNARYQWLGSRPRSETLSKLAGSRLLLLTSQSEGGANVISEAIASGVPVLSTRIDGSVGILGPNYPGYFPVGDAAALAEQLQRAEDDGQFLSSLMEHIGRLKPLVEPGRERAAWGELLRELLPDGTRQPPFRMENKAQARHRRE